MGAFEGEAIVEGRKQRNSKDGRVTRRCARTPLLRPDPRDRIADPAIRLRQMLALEFGFHAAFGSAGRSRSTTVNGGTQELSL